MFEVITIDELLSRLNGYSHNELHVHHTWSPRHKDFNGSNGIALQEAMKRYHVDNLGWSDIGQHVTLLPDGLFVTGRDFGKTPASISGYNVGGFTMEMLGDFDIGNDVFQGEQKNSALKLAKYFIDRGRYVRFHRENSPKTCPGTSIDKDTFINEAKSVGVAPQVVDVIKSKVEFNENVLNIQKTLNRFKIKGVNGLPLKEDGLWGTNTDHAMKEFRSIMAIDENADVNICFAQIFFKPTLAVDKGQEFKYAIRYLQWRVGTKVDSDFGWITNRFVAIWQGQNQLKQDGVCGRYTWDKLIG